MKRLSLLIALTLILSVTTQAQDTSKKVQPPPYKVFFFTEDQSIALYNMLGLCPDEVKGSISLKDMRKQFVDQFNHQPQIPQDTAAVAKAPVAKKKKK